VTPTLFHRALVLSVLVASAVGLADAIAGRVWDHTVLHAAVLAVGLVLLGRTAIGRRLVPLRADLHRWLNRYAADGGEEVEQVLDRALSAYRDGLSGFASCGDEEHRADPRL
jgi:hypothetical protein